MYLPGDQIKMLAGDIVRKIYGKRGLKISSGIILNLLAYLYQKFHFSDYQGNSAYFL